MPSWKVEESEMKTYQKNYIIYQKGDIFDLTGSVVSMNDIAPSIIIPHVCNNVDVFSSGFAMSVSKRYPIVKENFHMLGKKAVLGNVQNIIAIENKKYNRKLIISNMIAQNGLISKSNRRPLNYGALCYCMYAVKSLIEQTKRNIDHQEIEIHAPKFGCGLSGGDWKIIEALITDIWLPCCNVFIYMPSLLKK